MDNPDLQTPSVNLEKRKENMNQNMNVPRNFESSTSSGSSEHAHIRFNTGVSIFTMNILLVNVWMG